MSQAVAAEDQKIDDSANNLINTYNEFPIFNNVLHNADGKAETFWECYKDDALEIFSTNDQLKQRIEKEIRNENETEFESMSKKLNDLNKKSKTDPAAFKLNAVKDLCAFVSILAPFYCFFVLLCWYYTV